MNSSKFKPPESEQNLEYKIKNYYRGPKKYDKNSKGTAAEQLSLREFRKKKGRKK